MCWLSWNPAWLKFLQARRVDGKFKIAMGFHARHQRALAVQPRRSSYGKCLWLAVPCPPGFRCVVFSGEFFQRGRKASPRQLLFLVLTLVLLIGGYAYALEASCAGAKRWRILLRPVR